jgi:hypothetical protein
VRWKLLIAASVVAALVGAGACLLTVRLLGGATPGAAAPGVAWAVLLLPLGAAAAASVFVYRHTARRRALQASATALLALLLTLTALVAGSLFLGRPPGDLAPLGSFKAGDRRR